MRDGQKDCVWGEMGGGGGGGWGLLFGEVNSR